MLSNNVHQIADKYINKANKETQKDFQAGYIEIKKIMLEEFGKIDLKGNVEQKFADMEKYNRIETLSNKITDILIMASINGINRLNKVNADIYIDTYNNEVKKANKSLKKADIELSEIKKKQGKENAEETKTYFDKLAVDKVKTKAFINDKVKRALANGLQENITGLGIYALVKKVAQSQLNEIATITDNQGISVELKAVQDVGEEIETKIDKKVIHTKTWITERDSKVRPAHRQADGQTVLWKEYFTVGGEKLFRPKDPNGSAKNIINCRCWLQQNIKVEEDTTKGEEIYKR